MAVTPNEISRVPIQTTNEEKSALTSTEVEGTKEQVLSIRHKLQKVMLSRNRPPQDSDMPAVSDDLKWLEDHDIDAKVIGRMKIDKVLMAE
jgi:hypothetical protein